MELDRKDRLILFNQYRILELLNPKEADYYQRAQAVMARGYEFHYESLAENIYKNPMPEKASLEVHDILQMHRDLNDSFNGLKDKAGIDPHDLRFMGFDGNNEG